MVNLFNLKFASHVKANRKGIIAHTGVSTGALIPLVVVMERSSESTNQCILRGIDFLFCTDGSTNLNNVVVHSDRGYMVPSFSFDYMISNGGDFVGTVKRMAQCWPFTYKQTQKKNDKRTVVDVKGAPTLFLKYFKTPVKCVFASAFRNGSESVATAILTLHCQHQWEGIALHPIELRKWNGDKTSLKASFLQRVKGLITENGIIDSQSEEEKRLMSELIEKIEVDTLRQGKFCHMYDYFCVKKGTVKMTLISCTRLM